MNRISKRAFLALLLAVLFAVPAGVILWSHRETTAYYENRTLAERPTLTWQSLWDGTFATAFESWFSDHAPGRTTLLEADTAVQMKVLRRPVVNDIVLSADGVLVPFLSYDEYTEQDYAGPAASIAENYGKLNDHVKANGGSFYFVGLPEQRVYFEEKFPDYLNNHETEAQTADALFIQALEDQGVRFLNMEDVYDELGRPEEFYSTVDHHYNYYGAYTAYRSIMDTLASDGWDLPVLTEDKIDLVEQPFPYIGSRNRKLYNLWPNTDKAVIGVQKDPVAFTRYDNGELSDKPLFILPEDPAMPTTYNLYMGGDFGETVLETDRPELPDVLIFGDSFTNALETLLYASFDETHILDLRYYTDKSLKDYISDYQPDIVLCVQNDTFYYTTTGNGNVWED